MQLEGLVDGHAGHDSDLDPIVGGGQAREEINDLLDLVPRDNDDAIDWVAEDEVARVDDGAVDEDGDLHCPRSARGPCSDGGEASCPDLQGWFLV
jgi:hypothetical protein